MDKEIIRRIRLDYLLHNREKKKDRQFQLNNFLKPKGNSFFFFFFRSSRGRCLKFGITAVLCLVVIAVIAVVVVMREYLLSFIASMILVMEVRNNNPHNRIGNVVL